MYFLFGTDKADNAVVYIGQAGVRKNGKRLLLRVQEAHNSIDYWTEAVMFTTTNNSFGPTEISYLENRFCNIHSIRGVLRPAFQMAVDDDLIRKNPFGVDLASVVVNDSVTRESITRKQDRGSLRFVKEDKHISKCYDGIYILFRRACGFRNFVA